MSTASSTQNESPFNIWWVVSGIGVVLAIVALVVVLMFGRGGETPGGNAAPVNPPATEPSPPGDSGEESASGCNLNEDDQDIPVAAPEATWTTVGYLLVPSSNDYGPVPLEGSEWSCFAQSPTGALFAAAHVLVGAGGSDYESFMTDAAVSNAAREAWIAGESPETRTQTPGNVAQFAGFQMAAVAADRVTVKLAMTQSGISGSYTADMVWDSDADTWKVDMTTSTFFDELALLENLDAFTPWSATNGS